MKATTLVERAKSKLGIEELTPMQKVCADLPVPARALLLSPTGSGKTLAFAIPFLRGLKPSCDGVKGLVLVPTRELALQVYELVRVLGAPEYKTTVLYGGHSMATEEASLAASPDIVIATPGRLLDHLHRGHTSLQSVQALVLDEYDKSLELGFLPDMEAIIGRLKGMSTLLLTSATRLHVLPECLGSQPIELIDFTKEKSSANAVSPDITFQKVESLSADKLDTLVDLLHDLGNDKVIVFVNHRDAAERVYDNLKKAGFPVGMYHGGLEQDKRERALTLFANGTTPILVSTDLGSRGLDVDGVGAVVHYHLPLTEQAMTHRNGRTARMGRSGKAFVLISDHDKVPDFFPELEQYYPTGKKDALISQWATLHFNVGRKDKISRGDIVGYLIAKGGLASDEIGKISLADHQAYVAVPATKAKSTVIALAPHKIKNTRVRVSQVKA